MSRALCFDISSWPVPPIFIQIQEDGGISRDEMYRVFNMGLGMVLACDRRRVTDVLAQVPGALGVGEVVEDDGSGRVIL